MIKNICKLYCVGCGRVFIRNRKPGVRNQANKRYSARPANTFTCSNKCSMIYLNAITYGNMEMKK